MRDAVGVEGGVVVFVAAGGVGDRGEDEEECVAVEAGGKVAVAGIPEDDVAETARLSSDLGGFTVGHALVVDGGQTAGL